MRARWSGSSGTLSSGGPSRTTAPGPATARCRAPPGRPGLVVGLGRVVGRQVHDLDAEGPDPEALPHHLREAVPELGQVVDAAGGHVMGRMLRRILPRRAPRAPPPRDPGAGRRGGAAGAGPAGAVAPPRPGSPRGAVATGRAPRPPAGGDPRGARRAAPAAGTGPIRRAASPAGVSERLWRRRSSPPRAPRSMSPSPSRPLRSWDTAAAETPVRRARSAPRASPRGHRLERSVLSGGEGRLVRREQALRPAGDERRHPAERVGDVLSTGPGGRAGRHIILKYD